MILLKGLDDKNNKKYMVFGLERKDIIKLLNGDKCRFRGTDVDADCNYLFLFGDNEDQINERMRNEFSGSNFCD
jgi:hypothetical protein